MAALERKGHSSVRASMLATVRVACSSRDIAMNCSVLWWAESMSGFNLRHIMKGRSRICQCMCAIGPTPKRDPWPALSSNVRSTGLVYVLDAANKQLGGEFGNKHVFEHGVRSVHF